MKKVGMVASSGGHIEELLQLHSLGEKYECVWVTEKSKFQVPFRSDEKQYYVFQINRREMFFPLKLMVLFIQAIYFFIKEKPDAIISTGALMAYPYCVVGKILHKKVIYIESFARVNDLSLTGRLLYRHVDKFIVQWPEIQKKYPETIIGGGIF